MVISLEEFVDKTRKLLDVERQAEINETRNLQENVSPRDLAQRGVCILKLRIASQHTGLYGRSVLNLEPYWPGADLPSHKFTPGDIAGLSLSSDEGNQESLGSGIVSKVTKGCVCIAFDDSYDTSHLDDGAQYRITKLANDVTFQRMKRALNDLHKYRGGPSSHLIDVLFGSTPAPPITFARDGEGAKGLGSLTFCNENLDASQREAVEFALTRRDLAIVHGPPGTGKTTTVVEIIRQAVQQGAKVLACAPSNIAVDNLVERLTSSKIPLVRVGHPARLLPSIQKFALDAVIARSDEAEVVSGIKKDLEKTWGELRKTKDRGKQQSLRQEVKLLRKDLCRQEETATARVLKNSQVVLATLTTAAITGPLKYLEEGHFDLVIIDECSQALEAACWMALLQAPKCVLAGDHKQLPPTIMSTQAAKDGLEETLMERQIHLHGDQDVVRMLTMQYRMHHLIMDWSSRQLYEGRLEAHESVAQHLLSDLAGVSASDDTSTALVLIDTTGCDMNELNLQHEASKANEGEVELVAAHVESLCQSGVRSEEIAIITPYNLQVELLRLRLSPQYPKLEINSVDGFQGREKEAVILSLVRSNSKGEVGFLAEDRRINVAVTRARRHVAVICDTDTVSHHAFLKTLMEYMTEHGDVRSAQQYIQDGLVSLGSERSTFLETKIASSVPKPTATAPQNKGAENKAKGQKPRKPAPKEDHKKERKKEEDHRKEEISEEEIAEINELTEALQEFLASNRKQHSFPPTLSARQRYQVHELAEDLGLLHLSQGEGEERHIVVRKPQPGEKQPPRPVKDRPKKPPNTTQDVTKTDAKTEKDNENVTKTTKGAMDKSGVQPVKVAVTLDEGLDTEGATASPHQPAESICDKCQRVMPADNLALHQLRCTGNTAAVKPPQRPASAKGKSKKKKQKNAAPEEEEEDFDALIEAAIKENRSCAFKKCKASTATLGQNCEFCAKRYCLQHHIPEVHGCGDAAKSRARMLISREGKLYQGSGVPDKKLDPVKRAHLQRKLDKKLQEKTDERALKKKDKK